MTKEELVKNINSLEESTKGLSEKLGDMANPLLESVEKVCSFLEDGIVKSCSKQEILRLPFNINIHKKVFIHYLEVVIHPDGTIEYAVPSHNNKLFQIVYEKKTGKKIDLEGENFPYEQYEFLENHVPREYYFDMLKWHCNESECVSLWTNSIVTPEKGITVSQLRAIRKLQEEGLFLGKIPERINYDYPTNSC